MRETQVSHRGEGCSEGAVSLTVLEQHFCILKNNVFGRQICNCNMKLSSGENIFKLHFFLVVIRDLNLTPKDMTSADMWRYILS